MILSSKSMLSALRIGTLSLMGAGLATYGAKAQVQFMVTNGDDSGEGSLRAAIENASTQNTSASIFIVTRDDIEIQSTLTYSGLAPLALFGNGQSVRTSENVTLLALSEGADLSISNLNFKGAGQFDINNRGDSGVSPGKGIFIDVREDQTGIVRLELETVSLSGVAYHGIHVSDCDLADDCGGGSGGGGDGAPASIVAHLNNVEISYVGYGNFDADGIRIDERGEGDITFSAFNSTFRKVGADGVELDEGNAGSVYATTIQSRFLDNGDYCDPEVLAGFLPENPEGEFTDGEASEADIPGPVTGSLDDRCFERDVQLYDGGSVEEYEISIDLDDGIDIDEAGEGDLVFSMTNSEIIRNLDEGVDLDELDAGNAIISYVRSEAERNTDDGFRVYEAGPGDMIGFLHEVDARSNGGNGVRFDEEDEGTLSVDVYLTTTADNDDGDDAGIRVTKEGDPEGELTLIDSQIRDGIDARNVNVNEE